MKRWVAAVAALCLMLCPAGLAEDDMQLAEAQAFLVALMTGKAQRASSRLAAPLHDRFGEGGLTAVGEALVEEGGGFVSFGQSATSPGAVEQVVWMQRGYYTVKLSVNDEGLYEGIWVSPLAEAKLENTRKAGDPYVDVIGEYPTALTPNATVRLRAVLHNLDPERVQRYQWQNNASGVFEDVPGATEAEYTFRLGDFGEAGCEWRVNVMLYE